MVTSHTKPKNETFYIAKYEILENWIVDQICFKKANNKPGYFPNDKMCNKSTSQFLCDVDLCYDMALLYQILYQPETILSFREL